MEIPERNLLYKKIGGEKRLCLSYSQLTTFMDCPRRWYYTYILGNRSMSKSEATSYGTCIHQTLEHFFDTGRSLTRQQLCDTFSYYAEEQQIPFISIHSQLKAQIDAMKIINWISDIYEQNKDGVFIKPNNHLSKAEYILRMSDVAGVEEEFVLKYKLPQPITINGIKEKYVYFVGSLDLHLEKNGFHTIIDWKSDGKGYYDEDKLANNLQHAIYSMYVLRKYGKLPGVCFYVHTRSQVCESLIIDNNRIKSAVNKINSTLKHMYSFASEYADKCKAKDPAFDEMELIKTPQPTPLCFWCDFSRTSGNGLCEFSSSYTKNTEEITIDDILQSHKEIMELRKKQRDAEVQEMIKKAQEEDKGGFHVVDV